VSFLISIDIEAWGVGVSVTIGGTVFVGCKLTIGDSDGVGMGVTIGADIQAFKNNITDKAESNLCFIISHSYFEEQSTQRFALPACGRAWTRLGSRKNPKPEKCL
jgi:hypothetical protein